MSATAQPGQFAQPELLLRFVEGGLPGYLEAIAESRSRSPIRRILLHPQNALATDIRQHLTDSGLEIVVQPPKSADSPADLIVLVDDDPVRLSADLMQLVDRPAANVIAPKTSHYFARRPLYLISIPKAGTHLLYELAQAFGYRAAISCAGEPHPGFWYCVEYTNSHTVARDFFVDTVRREAFGNRHHPFMRTPALFIYRNPLDILVSEANYYHRDGKTAFARYLARLDFAGRLATLVGEDWLLGSLRSRIGGFLPWLEFDNVAPIAFEELIGAEGGGDDTLQTRLIWSLQLKLHVPGNPRDFAARVFNRDSATFNEGRIGSFRQAIPPDVLRKIFAQPTDFMEVQGYWRSPRGFLQGLYGRLLRRLDPRRLAETGVRTIPSRLDEFRRRPLRCDGDAFDTTPMAIESDYLGYNIVRYKGCFAGMPQRLGPVNLDAAIANPPAGVVIGKSVDWVKFRIGEYLHSTAKP